MLATTTAATLVGVDGHPVRVEVHVGNGLPSFAIVGLPDASCREARDRVRAAIQSSGLEWPLRRITVNLAPSALPKVGTSLDLGIAVGVLVASGQVATAAIQQRAFLGELGLDGSLRPSRGTVPLVAGLRPLGAVVVVPTAAHAEASLVPGVELRCAPDLGTVVRALNAECPWPDPPPVPVPVAERVPDLADVRGQPVARQVVEIAAAGGHHVLLSGPPGAGKTLLASRLPGLLPDLDDASALEVTAIHSAAGVPVRGRLLRRPPFRAPHHTVSAVAVVGGGSHTVRPGEASMAHRGVLFLDELGEFPANVLDALRQPIEEGVARVSRVARGTVTFPARFQLIAATNPCPCGPTAGGCRCSENTRLRYVRRLSGPLLDRIDLRLELGRPDAAQLLSTEPGEPTAVVAARVRRARELAAGRGVRVNADLDGTDLDRLAPITAEARRLLERMVRDGRLTGRGVGRIRRVARTIADLEADEGVVGEGHVAAALALRLPVAGAGRVAS